MHFHQIFSIALPSEDIQFISFWQLFSNNCCHSNTFNILGSERFGLLQILRLYMNLYLILSIALPKDHLNFLSFGLLLCNYCCHANGLLFWGLKDLNFIEPKPLHGFPPNIQHTFTLKGSTVSLISVPICQQLLPQQDFPSLWGLTVLKILTSIKLKPVHQFSTNCFLIIPSNWAGVPACGSWLFLKFSMCKQSVRSHKLQIL